MRQLALSYVTGMKRHDYYECVNFNLIPGVGEYFVFPALTTRGGRERHPGLRHHGLRRRTGRPDGHLGRSHNPEQHLEKSLDILKTFVPWEYERSRDCQLTDANGILAGRITPTVQRGAHPALGPQGNGSGRCDLVNDPITGQGSNNATKSARHYLEAILARGARPSTSWMNATRRVYEGYAEKVVRWTNSLLFPPAEHVIKPSAPPSRRPASPDALPTASTTRATTPSTGSTPPRPSA